jgi:alpha-beta hydrolase superfamily lysophospholipase
MSRDSEWLTRHKYGSIRVYEWGPEEGRRVLLVHGITTPCITLGAVAHGLAGRGCRVMLLVG